MKIAVDIDGTLGHYPNQLGGLLERLSGVEILLLTGNGGHYVADLSDEDKAKETARWVKIREDQLRRIGILPEAHYHSIYVMLNINTEEICKMKAQFIKENNISIFIDDFKPYCTLAKQENPSCLVLRVFELTQEEF